jgi:hypothetical protein
MKDIYPSGLKSGLFWGFKLKKLFSRRSIFFICNVVILFSFLSFTPSFINAQKLIFSYSYQNVTRNSTGGTLENGDIIEVHALLRVNKTTNSIYYIDSIPTGTQYVSNSLKIVTNEGLTFRGPYTDASGDDLGLYVSGTTPRIRVNIGTSAANPTSGSFGTTSGGGTVIPGDKPKFYSTTLFMVAYRLKITASFGDTIHLTGNYYFDTSGTKTSYRFDYAGIKIIQNSGLCSNFSSASFTTDSSFGSGNIQNRVLGVAGGNDYNKVNMAYSHPADGEYAIANNTSADGTTDNTGPYSPTPNSHRVFNGFWDIIGDHTGATNTANGNPPVAPGTNGGYMLVVNAAFPTGEAFHQTISNVCPNTNYEFSAWVRNICGVCGIDANSMATHTPGVLPNLSFAVNNVDYYTTGDIPHDNTWQKRGFMYKTGPTETSFTISIKNNAAGGGGDDWVMDDIKLATCYPNLVMNPSDTATACAGWPITLSDTIKSYFNNYVNYRWETSTDGITWNAVNAGSSKVPVVENGLYVYHVDTVLVPVKADSATYYRVKVGTTTDNLDNPNCSVYNSQKIFLKVYSTTCPLLDVSLLNFNGALVNDKAVLRWTSENESNLLAYEVEKSFDGIHFTKVGKVAALNEAGSSSYTFNDPASIINTAFYRLKLLNKNSVEYKYSKIASVYNTGGSFTITTVNPFKNSLKMNVFVPSEGVIEFNLCDIFGNIVKKKTMELYKGNSQQTLDDLYNLPTGIYILRAQFNGNVVQNKLIKTY